jgi:hypothetical protein
MTMRTMRTMTVASGCAPNDHRRAKKKTRKKTRAAPGGGVRRGIATRTRTAEPSTFCEKERVHRSDTRMHAKDVREHDTKYEIT